MTVGYLLPEGYNALHQIENVVVAITLFHCHPDLVEIQKSLKRSIRQPKAASMVQNRIQNETKRSHNLRLSEGHVDDV